MLYNMRGSDYMAAPQEKVVNAALTLQQLKTSLSLITAPGTSTAACITAVNTALAAINLAVAANE